MNKEKISLKCWLGVCFLSFITMTSILVGCCQLPQTLNTPEDINGVCQFPLQAEYSGGTDYVIKYRLENTINLKRCFVGDPDTIQLSKELYHEPP